MSEPVPWPVTAVESRGGAWLRISHEDGTVADHDLAYLIGRTGVFASFTAETIAAAQLIDGTLGWVIDGAVVDLAPDGLWDHAHGRCGGGGCTGWTPEQTVVVGLVPRGEVQNVGDLIEALRLLNPDLPVLIEGSRSGFEPAAVDVIVMQELAGHGRHGRFQFPTEADRLISRRNAWEITEDGPPPTLVGAVFAAAVIFRRRG